MSSDDITEDQLQEIWKEVQEEEAAEDKKEAEHNDWLAKRDAKIMEIKKILTTTTSAPKSKHERLYHHSDQSGSELDSADAADSPMITEDLDQDQTESAENSASQTPTQSAPSSAPPGVSSSPSSSPLLTALLHSPSKTTTLPTSPTSRYAPNPYKAPTSGTNLLHKFSPTTSSLTTSPLITTTTSSTTLKTAVVTATTTTTATSLPVTQKEGGTSDKEDDYLADIADLLKDKLREGEITKEDNIVDHDTDPDAEESNAQQESKDTVKEEGKEDSKENIPTIKNEEIQSESDQNINEDKLNTIDVKEETCPVKAELDAISPVVKPSEGPAAEVAEAKAGVASVAGLDGVESVPGSPLATPTGSRSLTPTPATTTPPSAKSVTIDAEDRDQRAWKKSIILVWGQISQHKNANLFANAVTEADAPDYRDIVFRPMDLNSIKKNVESGHIRTTEEFERDLMLMFFNATMYNSSDHEVYKLTRDMAEDTEKVLRDYKNAQMLLKESEPKSLRGKSESAETTVATRPRGRFVS